MRLAGRRWVMGLEDRGGPGVQGRGVARVGRLVWAAVLLGGLVVAGLARAQTADPALVAKGEYLTQAADCVACHTVPGGKAFAGGLAIALPVGDLITPNITPDQESGIGRYTDDAFVRAMQEGIARDGRHLYPAFPYTSYTLMSREDILAIKAYLFSLKPVAGAASVSRLQFPFDQRWGMAVWNLLFNPGRRFEPDAGQSAEVNRGAYLVQGPGHCGECHTPRNAALAKQSGQQFAGAVAQGWNAYNITADAVSGIGGWSDEQLASYLASAHGDQHSAAAGPMGEVVENSLRHMTPADIHAMVAYLRTVKPIRNAEAVAANPPARQGAMPVGAGGLDLGQRVFASQCANCHGWDGRGIQAAAAGLVGNRTVNDPAGTNLVQVLLEGAHVRGATGSIIYMPPFGRAHGNAEIAAVANFVNQRFGGGTLALTAAAVEAIRHPAPQSVPQALLWGVGAAVVVVVLLVVWLLASLMRRRRVVPRAA